MSSAQVSGQSSSTPSPHPAAINVQLGDTSFLGANYDSTLAVLRLSCLSHSCEIASPFIRPNETAASRVD